MINRRKFSFGALLSLAAPFLKSKSSDLPEGILPTDRPCNWTRNTAGEWVLTGYARRVPDYPNRFEIIPHKPNWEMILREAHAL